MVSHSLDFAESACCKPFGAKRLSIFYPSVLQIAQIAWIAQIGRAQSLRETPELAADRASSLGQFASRGGNML